MSLTRRLFIRWSAFATTTLALARRNVRAQSRPPVRATELQGLEGRALVPLAQAVLPAELGAARVERAAAAFAQWIAGYREGEETLHPYGSERLGKTGPSPATKWTEQLKALDASAAAAHQRPFALLSVEQRASLVQAALASVQFNARVPAPGAAQHVAIALLSYFLESAEATNLAYGRVIDPKQCRPLSTSPNLPVALQRVGRA